MAMLSSTAIRLFSNLSLGCKTYHSKITSNTKAVLSLYFKNDTKINSKNEYHNLTNKLNDDSDFGLLKTQDKPNGLLFTRNASRKIETIQSFKGIEIPEDRQRLKFMDKVPNVTPGMKHWKMMKNLDIIRGEEEVHTDFLHEQYGIVALRGGFLRHGHMEMIRLGITRRINDKKMFAIWRIEAPWKPHTKKGIGRSMGRGKGNISYYSTPIKARRVIIEVAGKCTFEEVKPMLDIIAHKLPFPAAAMSQKMIEDERIEMARLEKENLNPFTFKYMIQNNMLGSNAWAKIKIDHKYFGKYV